MWWIVTPVPTLTWLLFPSRVIKLVPIVKIPVTLALPFTISAVVAPPTTTLLSVEIPETLNCLVNSVGPVTVVIPANVERPITFRLAKLLGAFAIADPIVAVVVASSETMFCSSLAELMTWVEPILKEPTVPIPVTLSSSIIPKAYWRFCQEVVPIPTLNLPVSNSNPSSPSARTGFALVQSASVPLLNWILVAIVRFLLLL